MPTIYEPYTKSRNAVTTQAQPARIKAAWVKKLLSYYAIPTFSVDNIWRGASTMVYRFDFPIGLVTLLNQFPMTPPDGSNFCPVVSWRVGQAFVRYKLWEDVGEILWLPLYSGQKVTASSFHVEIWNVRPRILVEFDGEEDVIVEHEGEDPPLLEFDIAPGEPITTQLLEPINLYTSRLVIPTSYCDISDVNLGSPTACVDPIYYLEDFQPIYGDYYLLVAPCERQLIKFRQSVPLNYLQNRDDLTWHRVWAQFVDGNLYFFVDPEEVSPPDGAVGYFALISRTDQLTYKMELEHGPDGTGNYVVIDTLLTPSALDVNNILLQDTDTFTDTILWALYIKSNGAGGQTYEFITTNSFNGGIT